MLTGKRRQITYAQAMYLIAALVALSALSILTLELYFFVALIGILFIIELTDPQTISPGWRRRVRRLALIGVGIFTILALRKLILKLPPGTWI